jgi:hypothetical protein
MFTITHADNHTHTKTITRLLFYIPAIKHANELNSLYSHKNFHPSSLISLNCCFVFTTLSYVSSSSLISSRVNLFPVVLNSDNFCCMFSFLLVLFFLYIYYYIKKQIEPSCFPPYTDVAMAFPLDRRCAFKY